MVAMSAMLPSIDTRALEPPTSATTVATTVASSVSHLCHFVHEWLDFRVPELLAAAEAVGVDVSATDADIDELSAGARAASTNYPPAIQPWTPNCLTEGEKVTCVWCVSRWSSLELCGW